MSLMEKMMERMTGRMKPEEKERMMEKMMEKFFEDMKIEEKQKLVEEMMPKIMENCLSSMSREERTKMFTFCHTMLKEIEDKFLKK